MGYKEVARVKYILNNDQVSTNAQCNVEDQEQKEAKWQ